MGCDGVAGAETLGPGHDAAVRDPDGRFRRVRRLGPVDHPQRWCRLERLQAVQGVADDESGQQRELVARRHDQRDVVETWP